MKVPYGGNVSARLIQKRFSKKVFYYIHNPQGGLPYTIMFGFLKFSGGLLRHPMINYFDSDNVLSPFCQCVSLNNVYETLEEAEVALRVLNNLYEEGFAKRPFIRPERLKTSKGIMVRTENVLNILFKGDEKFKGVSFTDVGAGGIVRFLENYFDSRIFEQRKQYDEFYVTTDEVEVEMSLEILTILAEQVTVVVDYDCVILRLI